MVVRLDLERHPEAVAHVDHPGIFLAGSHDHLWRTGGESLQQRTGIFVGAVFAPHDGEDAQLGEVWLAAEDLKNVLVFLRRDAVFLDDFRGDLGVGHLSQPAHLARRPQLKWSHRIVGSHVPGNRSAAR